MNCVEEFKLLGLKLSSNLSWNSHINYIIKKANSRIWTIIRLKNNRVATHTLIKMYQLRVRSLLEFMVPAFAGSLSQNHIRSIERVQKRYLKCILGKEIFTNKSYLEVCKSLGMKTLQERRNKICIKFVKRSLKHHPDLFPVSNNYKKTRKGKQMFLKVPKSKTKRYDISARVFLPRLYNSTLQK